MRLWYLFQVMSASGSSASARGYCVGVQGTYGSGDGRWYAADHAGHIACHLNRGLGIDFGGRLVLPECSRSDSRAVSLLKSLWNGFRSHIRCRQTQVIDKRLVFEHVGEGRVLFQNGTTKRQTRDSRSLEANQSVQTRFCLLESIAKEQDDLQAC